MTSKMGYEDASNDLCVRYFGSNNQQSAHSESRTDARAGHSAEAGKDEFGGRRTGRERMGKHYGGLPWTA